MTLLSFKKGVYTPHGKYLTENKEIEDLFPQNKLIFPMSQHIGAPCQPIVKKGDEVLVGQKIGDSKSFVSSNIYSSVSGTVKDITPHLTANGNKVNSIIIENDNNYTNLKSSTVKRDYTKLSKDEIIKIIKEAGIVGMGGACFPTHVKLTPPPNKNVDYIIVNAAECEPYLTCDYRLMIEETENIVEGLKILLHIFPQAKGYIGIENNKYNAIKAMKNATKDIPNIEVKVLKTKYPQGSEKQLIAAITKREIPSGKLPIDVGCIVQNVDTIYEIYKTVVFDIPLTSRIVTVSGKAIKNPKNLRVKLGTPMSELIEACGGFKEEPFKLISGGPMMGITISSLDIPVVKGTSGILCFNKEQAILPEASSCIRCGKCVETCPMNLFPYALDSLGKRHDYKRFEELHGLDCLECGCCTFVCPSKRHIVQSIRTTKRTILNNNKNKAN